MFNTREKFEALAALGAGGMIALCPDSLKFYGFIIAAILGLPLCLDIIYHATKAFYKTSGLKTAMTVYIVFLIIGAIGLAGMGSLLLLKNKEEAVAGNPLDGSIVFECIQAKLPSVTPPEGKINMLDTQYNSIPHMQGLGLSIRMGAPGEPIEWEYINQCHKCTVKNYSPDTAFNIMATIQTSFMEWIEDRPGSRHTGAKIATMEYAVPIPVLKGNGSEAFEFYVINYSQNEYSYSVPLETVKIGKIGDKKEQAVKIGYTSGGVLNVGMGLEPADFSKKDKPNVTRKKSKP